jgi:hypothetical protein
MFLSIPRPFQCRAGAFLIALFSLTLLAASPVSAEDGKRLPKLDPGYSKSTQKVVLITDQAINPRVVTLDEGQLLAWISYSNTGTQIVFERDIAKNMICHSLVNFSLVEDELRSAVIQSGEFASFCELKPGRYEYRIVREASAAPGVDVTARRLTGEVIVGNPD